MTQALSRAESGTVYEALAGAVDAVGAEQAALYLAKLALALADTLGDAPRVLAVIEECRSGLASVTVPA